MSERLGIYKNKTTIDFEFVAAMEVLNSRDVKVIFKTGAVVVLTGYENMAIDYQEYMKSKYSEE